MGNGGGRVGRGGGKDRNEGGAKMFLVSSAG